MEAHMFLMVCSVKNPFNLMAPPLFKLAREQIRVGYTTAFKF
jgi:hypothetical protein